MNHALLVAKNLGRRKLRTALMLVAIFIAFFLFGCLESFNHAFYSGETAAAADRLVTVNRINFTMPLPISYVDRIRQIPGVVHVTPQSWFGGYYQDPREPLFMMATDPQAYLDVYPAVRMAPAQRQAWLTERTALAVGRVAADKHNWKVGDHIPISSNIYSRANGSHSWEFTVAAVFTSPDDPSRESMVMMHHDYFDDTVTFGRDQANMIIFTTASAKLKDSIAKAVDAGFANSPAETTTDTAAAFNRAFTAQLGNIALIISLVVATAFAAILLIVGNTRSWRCASGPAKSACSRRSVSPERRSATRSWRSRCCSPSPARCWGSSRRPCSSRRPARCWRGSSAACSCRRRYSLPASAGRWCSGS
jgi:putative ABC transport system permease protein